MAGSLLHVLVLGGLLAGSTAWGAPTALEPVVGSGNTVSEERSVEAFTELHLATIGTVVLAQGPSTALVAEGEDNILPNVRTRVSDNRLTIDFEPGTYHLTRPLTLYVTVPEVTLLHLSGSGRIDAAELGAGSLEVGLSGSGAATIGRLSASALAVQISGSGAATLAGQTDRQAVTLTGSGQYRAGDLKSQRASVAVRGSGAARVWATDALDVTIIGSGGVEYGGGPDITRSITGSGRLVRVAGD
ncbi:MAG: DUF2807 domain-containing protein [Chloroflexi bacterium]|nr:DUF2807 domain-containing protein [Chloroflexota bacterium]